MYLVHGMAGTQVYSAWRQMIARCSKEKHISYHNYGGREIKVCRQWLKFENFLRDMGIPKDSKLSLERKNNNGNYTKRNCLWTDKKSQSRNRRSNRVIRYQGKSQCLKTWCEELGLKYGRTYARLFLQRPKKTSSEAFYPGRLKQKRKS